MSGQSPRRPLTRQQLRTRKRELRARQRELKAELRRRVREIEAQQPRRKRWRWVLLVLVLLVLALVSDCSCRSEPVVEAEPVGEAGGAAAPVALHTPGPSQVEPAGRVSMPARGRFSAGTPAVPAWVAGFRLQVAARSSRLSDCFVGVADPGALKWTAEVEPSSGRVTQPTLEPTLDSATLSAAQRVCVFEVLSDPPYVLDDGGAETLPVRVGMVIEF